MSGSRAAPLYHLPAMNSHHAESGPSNADTPGSKRPFPWASSESERDKRPRSGADETMNTEASAAESNASAPTMASPSSRRPTNSTPLDLGWLTRQLDEALPPPRLSLSFGGAPLHSRASSTRVPLPWVDIDTSLPTESSPSSPGVASTIRSEPNLRNFPLADSPASAFASPRTSAFDLAVTPPGSALPSFVARMMEVDSPGGDSPETYIPSRTESYTHVPHASSENDVASIDVGQFMHREEDGGFAPNGQEQSAGLLRQSPGVAVDSYFEPRRVPLSMGSPSEMPQSSGYEQVSSPSNHHHPIERSRDTMGSIYSRRLTESGLSFPSRPSDSGSSLPSFRATVSPEPGRMSWSDLFGSRTPGTPSTRESDTRGSDIATSTRSEATMSMRASESSVGTRTDETTSMRTLGASTSTGMSTRGPDTSRAGVRSALSRAVRLSEGPPRLDLDPLPREDRTSATNLSRTPPGPAVWFEDNDPRPRTTRWTDLFPEPAAVPIVSRPTHRARMPPLVDSTALTGTSWDRNPPDPTYDAAESLARYQTFAQSIDEIRRSPLPLQSAPVEPTSWSRPPWAFPRHEPLQYPPPPPPADANWLREWESQRDRRSREARDDYIRRRDTSHDRRHNSEYGDEAPSVAQLNDTPVVWPDVMGRPRPRPRPMTRASLVATGFADSDLWSEADAPNHRLWGEIPPRPARRPELLPARTDDADTPMQFLPNTHEGAIFTESPPSLVADFNDPGPSISPSRPDPVNFRSASRVLRASLVDTSSRRPNDGPPSQPRVHSRDGWESQLSRSQVQLERVRQLLHRSNDSRDRPDPHRRSFLSGLDHEIPSASNSRRSSVSGVAWPRPVATEVPPPRPFSLHEGDRTEWSPPDVSRTHGLPHELIRASSLRGRRRRTLLPESASRRDSTGFLHSMNNALSQVESGLLHLNRELDALADQGTRHVRHYGQNEPGPRTPPPHMDWAFESAQRNPTPPPSLPPFEFASAQRNPGWPAERYSHLSGDTSGLGLDLPVEYPTHRAPTRGPEVYYDPRQNVRDVSSSTRSPRAASYAHEGSWRSSAPSNEWWSNDASSPSLPTHMPLRDRLLFRPSGSGHPSRQSEPVNSRSNSMGSSMQAQPPSATFGRLHRRRLSPPAPPHQPSVSSSLLRPFANQNSSTSPTRSYASRFSHFLPRRNSGRGGGGSSDDNDEWHHAEQATRRFFLRPRGRARPTPPNGDYLRDDEFDDSYEGLLRLAARIGDAKPRGTPPEVIRSMVSSRYADSPGARAEARCPICLDDYAPDNIVTVVKRCSHWFHRECVQQWLSNSRTCPVCRGQADGEEPEPQAGPSTDHPWM